MNVEYWESVVVQLAQRPELHGAWLNGLADNSAATGSVLSRIITVDERLQYPNFWLEWHDLTQEAGASLARHPDRRIRRQLAQNPSLSLDALAILGRDADRFVRMLAVESAAQRDRTLHRELAPERYGPGPADRAALAPQPPDAPLTEDEARALVTNPDRLVRAHAAWDERVPQAIALELAEDPDDQVRLYLSMRRDLSEQQCTAIAYIVPSGYHQVPAWLTELRADPQAVAEYAHSLHVLIRRSVAMARHLPTETAALLADDDDFSRRMGRRGGHR